jgi:hypothetical protein
MKAGFEWRIKIKEFGRTLNIPGKELFLEGWFQKND